MKHGFIGIALLLGALSTSVQVIAQPAAAPPCSDQSSNCLRQIAGLYLDALRTHDGARLPLAPGVRRSENALTNARGDAEVRESFARTTMVKNIRDVRYYIDAANSEVVVFFLIDVDLKANDANATTRSGDTHYEVAVAKPAGSYTVHEAERFKIVQGWITEIEIIAHVEDGSGQGSGWPLARDPVVTPGKPRK